MTMITKDQAVEAVEALLLEYGINVTREQATRLVEIGQRVRRIEWTPEQRANANAALDRHRRLLSGGDIDMEPSE